MRFYKLRKYFWHFFIPDRKRKMRAKAITENHYLSTDKIVPIANIYYYNWRWECVVRLESRTSFKYNKTDSLLLCAFIILLISFLLFLSFCRTLFSLFSLTILFNTSYFPYESNASFSIIFQATNVEYIHSHTFRCCYHYHFCCCCCYRCRRF